MNKRSVSLIALAACLSSGTAVAELVPVVWDANGIFAKQTPIAAGKFVEICEKLPRGARVAWSFEADSPLNFNVHYHEGKEVRFPAKQDQTASLQGVLEVQIDQDYCWMWTNKSSAPASVKVQLRRS